MRFLSLISIFFLFTINGLLAQIELKPKLLSNIKCIDEEVSCFEWEVRHRFRLIKTEEHSDALVNKIINNPSSNAGSLFEFMGKNPYNSDTKKLHEEIYGFNEYKTHWNEARAQYSEKWFHEKERFINIRLKPDILRSLDRFKSCVVSVNQSKPQTCDKGLKFKAVVGKKNTVKISIVDQKNQHFITTKDIELKDIKIATMGDSFVSGEGNPHTPHILGHEVLSLKPIGASWMDLRCHRSLLSSTTQAAMRMAHENKDVSVTFVSFACSGATFRNKIYRPDIPKSHKESLKNGGILSPYNGVISLQEWEKLDYIHPKHLGAKYNEKDIPAQIIQLKNLLKGAKLDYLFISSGGNELGFAPFVKMAIESKIDDTSPQLLQVAQEIEKMDTKYYKPLYKKLNDEFDIGKIVLLQYPNILSKIGGQACATTTKRPALFSFLEACFNISAIESTALREKFLIPLNLKIDATAKLYGYETFQYSQISGFCDNKPGVNNFGGSFDKQGDKNGTMHPNILGHSQMGQDIYNELKRLYDDKANSSQPL